MENQITFWTLFKLIGSLALLMYGMKSMSESLEEGKQIITGIVKPQINYKGVMIKSAQITVSQN